MFQALIFLIVSRVILSSLPYSIYTYTRLHRFTLIYSHAVLNRHSPFSSHPPFSLRVKSTPKAITAVDVDTRPSPVTKCTEDGQAVCINAGLRAFAPYFSFIDFPFCSGRWCESSSVITVHVSGGETATKRKEPRARVGADCSPHGARFRVRQEKEEGECDRHAPGEQETSNRYQKEK